VIFKQKQTRKFTEPVALQAIATATHRMLSTNQQMIEVSTIRLEVKDLGHEISLLQIR